MLLNNTEYKVELEKVVEKIKGLATSIDIRGNGIAQFIYAKNDFRAVEISQSQEGIWIEFWISDNEMPVKETTVSDYQEAASISLSWLRSE